MLTTIAWISIGIAITCSLIIAIDELRRPQKMAIMNIVWPITALYWSVFAVWGYFTVGIRKSKAAMSQRENQSDSKSSNSSGQTQGKGSGASAQHGQSGSQNKSGQQEKSEDQDDDKKPTFTQIAVAASHCGAGCTIADLTTEFLLAAFGLTLFGLTLWASFLYDFLVAWTLGILFQYFSIQPMRHMAPAKAILAAIKADTLSITAFQVGMYAWMALVFFVLFPNPHLTPFDPRFWLMMQIAMILGYATTLPMNRFLIGAGLKEAM